MSGTLGTTPGSRFELTMSVSSSTATSSEIGIPGERISQDVAPIIRLPDEGHFMLEVLSATVFYGHPNIQGGATTSSLTFEKNGVGTFTVELATGLYSISQLSSTVQYLLSLQGQGSDEFPLVSFVGDDSSGLVGITFLTEIDWRYRPDLSAAAIGVLIGWPQTLAAGAYNTIAPATTFGPVKAQFQTVLSYRVGCSLVSDSYLGGGGAAGDTCAVIHLAQFNANEFMSFHPQIPRRVPVTRKLVDQIRFRLTGQDGTALVTGEPYEIEFKITRA